MELISVSAVRLLLLFNVFDDVPVCRRVTDESWAWAVKWKISEMRVSKDEYAVTVEIIRDYDVIDD